MSLPSGYTRLEYIESTGTQYIDTGIKGTSTMRVKVEFMVLGFGSGTTFVFGSQTPETARYTLGFTSDGIFRSDFGSHMLSGDAAQLNTWYDADKNGNVCTIGSSKITNNSATFIGTSNIYLFARSYTSLSYSKIRMRSCKIYNGSTLVRDFIPCKNASGIVGLWDDVNSAFYTNSGSGSFVAGEIPIGTHKALVNGTEYEVTSGSCLVAGTKYDIKKGRTLIGGTGYDITLPGIGIMVSTLSVGQSVYMKVNGTAKEFIVVHQGKPSNIYDESCNGTWLLMKDIYENRKWHRNNVNKYESSDIHSYLNSTFLNLFDSNIRDAIKQVKIPYRMNGGKNGTDQSGANGLSSKIFLLSGYEVGWTSSNNQRFPQDGAKLDYFTASSGGNSKRIAYLNGSATYWWLRSPYTGNTIEAWVVYPSGGGSYGYASVSYGIRPAFIIRSDALIDADFNIIT